MVKAYLLAIIFIWAAYQVLGQKVIKGKVLEMHSNTPISYVNIGIVDSPVGTISNEDGTFVIEIPERHLKDTLTFSALGYVRKSVPVWLLHESGSIRIFLKPKQTMLKEVTVLSKRINPAEFDLGNRYHKGGLNLSSGVDATAGASVALLIENSYPSYHKDLVYPVFLKSAKVRIADNTVGNFKIRARIYSVDSLTGLPASDLLNESVVVESDIRKGWLSFDLSKHNLPVSGPFFMAFEWIMEETERAELKEVYRRFEELYPERVRMDTTIVDGEKLAAWHYINFLPGTSFGVSLSSFSLSNYQCFSRYNSLGGWKRAPYILTARVTVSDQLVSEKGVAGARVADTIPCTDAPPVCQARQLCQSFLDEYAIPGMQLSVSVAGETVLSEGFGYSNIETMTPVTTDTRFRIGSVSKALTSAALIKLTEEGKLNINAPVRNYVPDYPEKRYSFSTRQLAGHLAGLRHYRTDDVSDLIRTDHFKTATEAVTIFMNDSLIAKPGTQFQYSSFGWNLIGAVVEGAAKVNYLDYMYDNIWRPLGMMQTYGDVADSIMPNKSAFYYVTGEEAVRYDLSYKYPSDGLLSTTEDLVKFGNELLNGTYFDHAVRSELFETQHTSDNKPTNYGLGWNITKDRNGHKVWYHAGDLLEGSAYLLLYPDDGIVVAFLANSHEGISFDIQEIGALFYGHLTRSAADQQR